jgi:transcriptional antiterminator NusG
MRRLLSHEQPPAKKAKRVRCDGCTELFHADELYTVKVDEGRYDTNCVNCAKRWYVVATFEDDADVAARIMREARRQRLDDRIEETQVVRYKDTVVKDGKLRRLKRKAWEGYVLVKMVADGDTIHLVQGTKDVLGILPLKPTLKGYRYPKKEPKQARPVRRQDVEEHETWFPVPLTDTEIETTMAMIAASREPDPEPTESEVGNKVNVTNPESMWEGQTGVVTKVLGDQEYEVTFTVLGSPTKAKLNYIDLALQEELA